jgi:hypothetical protein
MPILFQFRFSPFCGCSCSEGEPRFGVCFYFLTVQLVNSFARHIRRYFSYSKFRFW